MTQLDTAQPSGMTDRRPFHDIHLQGAQAPQAPQHLVCVTIYNEDVAALQATLGALLTAVAEAAADRPTAHHSTCIALMLDGPDATAADVLAFLQNSGLLPTPCTRDEHTSHRFFFSERSAAELSWPAPPSPTRPAALSRHPISWVVCVKDRNRGKLHSHALFFGHLCARLSPVHCYQVDVGTAVEPGIFQAVTQAFHDRPEAAAFSACVITPAPGPQASVLARWQFMDMATQHAVMRPAEVACGQLSVLPGAFCAIRWQALRGDPAWPAFWTEADIFSAATAAHTTSEAGASPLFAYLRGLYDAAPLQRLMYLAEDRVMGHEITLGAQRWHLGYAPAAHATTDACKSLPELLRQRRRWNNSASACRLWMVAQWLNYLQRADRSFGNKIHFSLAMLWQLSILLRQWLAPAIVLSVLLLLGHSLFLGSPLATLGLLCLVAAASTLHTSPPSTPPQAQRVAGLRDALFWLATVCGTVLMARTVGGTLILALTLPWLGLLAFTCHQLPRHRWLILRHAPEFLLLSNPVLQIVLSTYAVARLDDVSWGTKGLLQTGQSEQHLRRWRRCSVLSWALLNTAVLSLGWLSKDRLFAPAGAVVLGSVTLVGLSVGAAGAFAAMQRWARRPGVATPLITEQGAADLPLHEQVP